MIITFKWSDGVVYEFNVSEDYGGMTMYRLWDAIIANPRLGKREPRHYEFEVKNDTKEEE